MHLYRFFDEEETLLYVGISKNFGQRIKEHEKANRHWFQFQKRYALEFIDSREAIEIERQTIQKEKPIFNKTHSAMPLKIASEYLQKRLPQITDAENVYSVRFWLAQLEISDLKQKLEDSYKQRKFLRERVRELENSHQYQTARRTVTKDLHRERAKSMHKNLKSNGKVWGKDIGPKSQLSENVRALVKKRRAEGWAFGMIAAELTELKIPTARGGKWHAATVKAIIKSKWD